LELGAWSLELGAWSLELGAWSLELGAWSLELGEVGGSEFMAGRKHKVSSVGEMRFSQRRRSCIKNSVRESRFIFEIFSRIVHRAFGAKSSQHLNPRLHRA
jgi:hypothetical protein